MLVHDGGDRVVLGRQAVWPPGRFSILAGFVEPGESAEAAVAREVAEEVGLQVTDVRYVGSQPWPFPQSLMLGFIARAEGADTLRLDPDEIEEARWFTRAELRAGEGPKALPPPVSIARHILDRWVAGEFD
jgi:NAD+ diphosphatase